MVLPEPPLEVGLVGAGRVGTAAAALLAESGHSIRAVASRTQGSAQRAADRLRAPATSLEDAVAGSDLVLIGAPDRAIAEVAGGLADHVERGAVVCHFAGSLGTEPLRALAARAAALCALHPVQACPDVATAIRRLPGSAWGVTCTEGASEWARRLVRDDLRGRPVDVDEASRPIWHAAAVSASNALAAVLAVAERLLVSVAIDHPGEVLGPLAAGALANALEAGGGAATMTGPVVRGESDTVRRHLEEIRAQAPDLVADYAAVARLILLVARKTGRVEESAADAMAAVLQEP